MYLIFFVVQLLKVVSQLSIEVVPKAVGMAILQPDDGVAPPTGHPSYLNPVFYWQVDGGGFPLGAQILTPQPGRRKQLLRARRIS